MKLLDTYRPPHAERTGFDGDLSEEETAIAETAHRFARDVMRPIGEQLDRMRADEVVAAESPFWTLHAEFAKLGIEPDMLADMPPATASRIESLLFEELGWGDGGLTLSLAVAGFPAQVALATGNEELIEMTRGRLGCWPVTQPDTGSDVIDTFGAERHPGDNAIRGNISAKFEKDEIVINGQTSAWVSNGTVAEVAVLCCPADYGEGLHRPDGNLNRTVILVPLDLDGITRGKPLEKLGQIPLPQGEIFFDDVRVPRRWAVCEGEAGIPGFLSVLAEAGVFMAQCFTGVARAAFEHALAYAHERKQGGAPLIRHQLVRYRLGEMYMKVEASRAMARRASHHLRTAPVPSSTVSSTAKMFSTQISFEVVNEALQLFGGNGLTREYPLEKLLRDVRAALIEDGENRFLTMRLGSVLSELYEAGWSRD